MFTRALHNTHVYERVIHKGFQWAVLNARDEQDELRTVVYLKSVHKRLQPGPCVLQGKPQSTEKSQ